MQGPAVARPPGGSTATQRASGLATERSTAAGRTDAGMGLAGTPAPFALGRHLPLASWPRRSLLATSLSGMLPRRLADGPPDRPRESVARHRA